MGRIDTLIDTLETLDATGHIGGKPFTFDMSDSIGVGDAPCGCLAVICKRLSEGTFSEAYAFDIEGYLPSISSANSEMMFCGLDGDVIHDVRISEAINMLKAYRETAVVDWSHVEDRWAREDSIG